MIDILPLLCDAKFHPLWDKFLKIGFANKDIVPLQINEFDSNKFVEAFRFMIQSKHVGNIVTTRLQSLPFSVTQTKKSLHGQINLIVGGLGGLGLSIASCLATEGFQEIYLLSHKVVTEGKLG